MGSAAKALAAKTRAEILDIAPGVHSSFSVAAINAAYDKLETDVRLIPDFKDRVHFVATKGAPIIVGAATALGGPEAGLIASALLAGVATATQKDSLSPGGATEDGLSDEAILGLLQKVSDIVLTPSKVNASETPDEDATTVTAATALLSNLAAGHKDTTQHHDSNHGGSHDDHNADPHHHTSPHT